MADAADIAETLLQLADAEPEPELVTNLRLQKLLYYAQGWSLALRGRALFDDPIEAWDLGPVVPSVYHRYRRFRGRAINDGDTDTRPLVDRETFGFVERIWHTHRRHSASALVDMTHRESPWADTDRGPGGTDRGVEIPRSAIRSHFEERLAAAAVPGVDPEHVWEARAEFARGGGRPLATIRAERDA